MANMLRRLVFKHLKRIVKKKALVFSDIPPGFLAVYVGKEHRRFLIPVRFLHFPVFISLLEKAGEEFGFKSSGGIVLPCEVLFFKRVLKLLEKDEKIYGGMDFDEFFNVEYSGCGDGFGIRDSLIRSDGSMIY